ncbi:MAG: RnfABCDGE type electron transport complex subunit D, partial [Bacteroidota bacterium]
MSFLQKKFDQIKPHFEKGGKWEKFYPIYEGHRTIFFSPDLITGKKGTQIKDGIDLKRMMMTVIISMIPCLIFGIWNVGHQHYIA